MSSSIFLPNIELLNTFSIFVLNRTSEDFRSELCEYLVIMALYENKKNKGVTIELIKSSIEKDLAVEDFPLSHIESALGHLQEKGVIKKVRGKQGDLYFLSQDEITRITLMEEQYSQTVAQVKISLGRKMKENGITLDMNEEVIVFTTFRNFLAVVLSNLGRECCFALISSHGREIESFKPINVADVLTDVLKTVENERLRQTERKVFTEYIVNPDDALSDFLYSLAQSYLLIQILHLDPQCQLLTAESLKRKRIYLDTNVIHHGLTGIDARKKAVDQALKLTKTLGITTVLSKRTKEEFLELLESRKKAFGKDPRVPKKRLQKIMFALEDGFLKDFLQKKSKDQNLTFERYADRLEEIETVLNNRYSSVFDDNEYKEIFENPDMLQLKEIVVNEGTMFGLNKNDRVAEHDAFHILLVQELRRKSESDILGPNFWFLTHDRSLFFVEKRFGRYEKFPSSIFVDNWVQLISPLLSPKHTKDSRDAYIALFGSRLPMLAGAIDEEVFLGFQGKWMDDEDLTPKNIARIIGNRFIKDYYETSKQKEEPIPEEDKEKMVKGIIAEIKTENREVAWMKKDIKQLQVETEGLKLKVNEWQQLSSKQKSILSKIGHVIGAILFFVLWLVLYEYFVRFHSVEHWGAFFASMLLAASVGAIADLFGYRWLLDRLLRYKGIKLDNPKEVIEEKENSQG